MSEVLNFQPTGQICFLEPCHPACGTPHRSKELVAGKQCHQSPAAKFLKPWAVPWSGQCGPLYCRAVQGHARVVGAPGPNPACIGWILMYHIRQGQEQHGAPGPNPMCGGPVLVCWAGLGRGSTGPGPDAQGSVQHIAQPFIQPTGQKL